MKIYVFIIGTIIGSFLYCFTNRIIKHESLVTKSHCEYCGHFLSLLDMIPIFSFLFYRGKCKYCNHILEKEYLIYELICGIVYLITYITKQNLIYYFVYSILISICIIDIKLQIIPNKLIIILILLNLLKIEVIFVINSIIISLIIYFLVKLLEKVERKELMGRGDIKLIFALGLYLNSYETIYLLLIASLFGIIVNYSNSNRFAFAPYLIMSFFIVNIINI